MLFAEQPADTLQSEAVKNAQRYYQSCMRTADIIEQHTGPDGEVLTNIMNVIGWLWPIVFDDISPNLKLSRCISESPQRLEHKCWVSRLEN